MRMKQAFLWLSAMSWRGDKPNCSFKPAVKLGRDQICLAPWGDLMICEDGPGKQYLRVLNPRKEYYTAAHNAVDDSEFAGVCFSPDGSTMFINIPGDGLTLAITGP